MSTSHLSPEAIMTFVFGVIGVILAIIGFKLRGTIAGRWKRALSRQRRQAPGKRVHVTF
jgi:hypothetical protein